MRSWIWGGALTLLTALGVSWTVAPPRPTECVLDIPAATPTVCLARTEVVAVTDALDVFDELRVATPSAEEPPLAAPRFDAPGEIVPAVFLLPTDETEEAPMPRPVLELAPMPRPHASRQLFTFAMGYGFGQ